MYGHVCLACSHKACALFSLMYLTDHSFGTFQLGCADFHQTNHHPKEDWPVWLKYCQKVDPKSSINTSINLIMQCLKYMHALWSELVGQKKNLDV